MRIALVNWTRRKVGGAETYLSGLLTALLARGHQIGFWSEVDESSDRAALIVSPAVTEWCAQHLGVAKALDLLRLWLPDVLYVQGCRESETEARLLDLGIPAVFFSHNYYGTCISGNKAFSFPNKIPCSRRFGAACLLHYYPRRCGGLNPATMWRDYRRQSRRFALLSRYRRLVVASEHMAAEYRRHGLEAVVIPHPAEESPSSAPVIDLPVQDEVRLLFIGRMENLKGGQLLLEALPTVARGLQKIVACDFIGAGGAQDQWQRQAAQLMDSHPDIQVRFHGWLGPKERDEITAQAHLLVVPSIWPEPFGLVGLEAGRLGLPAVAFAVGGIPEWLQDGVNGSLATGSPPGAGGLAAAIIAALQDAPRYRKLRQGAVAAASGRPSEEMIILQFEDILHEARQTKPGEPLSRG